ncbi:MAG: hypothetical protein QOE14_1328 [Humisphaera sp.]|nr:hypothetical protein [Humisphaera sp.]
MPDQPSRPKPPEQHPPPKPSPVLPKPPENVLIKENEDKLRKKSS